MYLRLFTTKELRNVQDFALIPVRRNSKGEITRKIKKQDLLFLHMTHLLDFILHLNQLT